MKCSMLGRSLANVVRQAILGVTGDLAFRSLKAKRDPYAKWDYVTTSLSESELKRIAKWLADNGV